jgi:dTMP kinase
MTRGRFITLEGIEGAGKSTVAQGVMEWLGQRQIAAVLTREPGGTPLAESVRTLVLTAHGEALSDTAETLLMFASRSLHVQNLILPALAAGRWVVCDRFLDATYAYQGSGRGVDATWLATLAQHVLGDLRPDCTVLLDVPVHVGLERARRRKGAAVADRFEQEGEAFFERVRSGYLALAAREPTRFRVIDATAPLSEVKARVAQALEGLMPAG